MELDTLVVCPVYNEQLYIGEFYAKLVSHYSGDILFVDDGSTDRSKELLRNFKAEAEKTRVRILSHRTRMGYGAALMSGFRYALENLYDNVITIDADLQHQPEDICRFIRALIESEVVLGSRYTDNSHPFHVPEIRFTINRYIMALLTKLLSNYGSLKFTDPFCGFRGYRRSFLEKARLREQSYGICLEVLMEIIRTGTTVCEIPVELIYFDNSRVFYDGLDNPVRRLAYYRGVIAKKMRELENEKTISGCISPSG